MASEEPTETWLKGDDNDVEVQTQEYVEDNDDDAGPQKSRKLLIVGVLVVAIAAIAIGVVVALSGGDKDGGNSVNAPSPTVIATPGPTPTYASEVRDIIVSASRFGGSEFADPNSYQSRALGWVLTQDLPAPSIPLSREEQAIQLYALACIYENTNAVRSDWTDFHFGVGEAIPGWFSTRGWLGSADEVCTNWYGITCNSKGQVEKIELDTNGLSGYFPPEVAHLAESLTYLDLYNNLVHNKDELGNSWLGEMTNMEYLYYGTTSFEYDGVPTYIGLLTKLKEYDFSYTLYFGELEAGMWSGLTNLNYLVMDGNAYNSTLPQDLIELPSLQYVYAGFSFLEGGLDFVSQMPAIFELWIDDNPGMAGTLPASIAESSTMVSFSATNCELTGTIPTELGTMTGLIQMWLYDNHLTGTIPTELGSIVTLKILNFQKNDLTGDMPIDLCFLRQPLGRIEELEADCDGEITCDAVEDCCTCCGEDCIGE